MNWMERWWSIFLILIGFALATVCFLIAQPRDAEVSDISPTVPHPMIIRDCEWLVMTGVTDILL